MEVGVSELRSISEVLFKHLEKSGQSSYMVQSDFYWQISAEKRYDSYNEPNEFSLGQLTDDWRALQQVMCGEKEPLGSDLISLANILRIIGENACG